MFTCDGIQFPEYSDNFKKSACGSLERESRFPSSRIPAPCVRKVFPSKQEKKPPTLNWNWPLHIWTTTWEAEATLPFSVPWADVPVTVINIKGVLPLEASLLKQKQKQKALTHTHKNLFLFPYVVKTPEVGSSVVHRQLPVVDLEASSREGLMKGPHE